MLRNRQKGFSLLEVLLALGLLAWLLISVVYLLAMGTRVVKSGRTASEALAVATTVLEEMQGWGFHQTHLMYGFNGSATSYTADTRTNSFASKWQPALQQKLKDSYATIALESVASTSPPPPLESTRSIRMLVTVHWKEGDRVRNITLSALKM